MKTSFIFQAYYYTHYHGAIAKAEHVGDELSKHLSNRNYVTDIELEELNFEFINTQNMKCRVRPTYMPVHDSDKSIRGLRHGSFLRNPNARGGVHQGER